MAAAIKSAFDDITEVKLVPGDRGEFTVWIDQHCLAKKTMFGFPTSEEVIAALQDVRASSP